MLQADGTQCPFSSRFQYTAATRGGATTSRLGGAVARFLRNSVIRNSVNGRLTDGCGAIPKKFQSRGFHERGGIASDGSRDILLQTYRFGNLAAWCFVGDPSPDGAITPCRTAHASGFSSRFFGGRVKGRKSKKIRIPSKAGP